MKLTTLDIEQIKSICSERESKFIELYLQKKSMKFICEALNLRTPQYVYIVTKYKLSRFRTNTKYYLDPSVLDKNNPDIWYVLGFFASDGNLYHKDNNKNWTTVQFTLKDKDPLESIVKILKYNGPILEYTKNKVGSVYYLSICNPYFEEFLTEIFGDCVRKTKNLKFPKIDNVEQAEMFLRGYFDGDGSFWKDSKYPQWYNVELYCDSESFLNSLCKYIKRILKLEINPKRKRFRIHSRKNVYTFFKFLYKNKIEIGLKRKRDNAFKHILEFEKIMK